MKDLHTLLALVDPVRDDSTLTPLEVAAIRRQMLEHRPAPRLHTLTCTAVIAVGLSAVMVAGVALTSRSPGTQGDSGQRISAGTGPAPLQMQFATPSGTQVIWIFNDTFDKDAQQ